jgi:hypothetical protein
MLNNYERLFRQVGWERFAAAVDICIAESDELFFPSIKIFKGFLPPPLQVEQREIERAAWERDMRAKRRQHPDEFFGEADVKHMMKRIGEAIEDRKPVPSADEILAEILEARNKSGFSWEPGIPQAEYEHFDS